MFGKKPPSPPVPSGNTVRITPEQEDYKKQEETLQRGMSSMADLIAPASIEVDFNHIRVGEKFYKTFFIAGYPRYVSANWLEPVIDFEHSMDVSMFIYPTSAPDVLSDLRRKIAEMEATIASDIEEGLEVDPRVKAQLEDALSVQ